MASSRKKCDAFQMDLMRLVDNELAETDRSALMEHLQSCRECNEVYEDFKSLKEDTVVLKPFLQPDLPWQEYWQGLYHRLERGLGWTLFSAGAIYLAGLAIYHLLISIWHDPQIGLPVKLAIYGLIFGGAILLISVAREKLSIRKKDKYRRIMQ